MSLGRLCLLTLVATIATYAMTEMLRVEMKEYDVPTPNSRPHDPALAPDGSLWYTGQGANKLGRLDPQIGSFKEYPLRTPNSGPHGLVADKDGNIWFTAISGGYVGKLDPRTGEIVEYRPSDGTEIDPHTPVFDHDGILWFTNEDTNYLGRLDPRTGKITLAKVPTSHAVPYGIVILQNNTPFFCEFGTNQLAKINPKTMTVREYKLPRPMRARGASRWRLTARFSTLTTRAGTWGTLIRRPESSSKNGCRPAEPDRNPTELRLLATVRSGIASRAWSRIPWSDSTLNPRASAQNRFRPAAA